MDLRGIETPTSRTTRFITALIALISDVVSASLGLYSAAISQEKLHLTLRSRRRLPMTRAKLQTASASLTCPQSSPQHTATCDATDHKLVIDGKSSRA